MPHWNCFSDLGRQLPRPRESEKNAIFFEGKELGEIGEIGNEVNPALSIEVSKCQWTNHLRRQRGLGGNPCWRVKATGWFLGDALNNEC